jgi:hypothetical protein
MEIELGGALQELVGLAQQLITLVGLLTNVQ